MREKLQAARKAKGLTQQAVAEYLGISERYYRYIESGTRDGDLGRLRRFIQHPPKNPAESLCQRERQVKH